MLQSITIGCRFVFYIEITVISALIYGNSGTQKPARGSHEVIIVAFYSNSVEKAMLNKKKQ